MQRLFIFAFLLISSSTRAQEKFEIQNTGTKYSIEQIAAAFKNADFCGSFYNTKRNIIKLDDGAIVELFSKSELSEKSIALDAKCFLNDDVYFFPAIWSVSAEGHLFKGSDTDKFKSEKDFLREKSEKE
jgi:hypothetical protein